ncbi:sugar ABC transporter ATP-binding protein [Microbacterium sp. X-17]|uniref:sugar ABC transporter ATP-binding protein n=1 Tax=Microbacterium sp. X-17 TaxID=3144404 RepID=UPI0031F4D4EB
MSVIEDAKRQAVFNPALAFAGLKKAFGSVVAVSNADLTLRSGSIHALVGENGAGKSTIVKIIAGLYSRDSGTFELAGSTVNFTSTAEARRAGIAVIYQEPTLFPDLSVAENVFMGRQPMRLRWLIDKRAMREETIRLIRRLGVDLDPDRQVSGLSIADQQIVEIAKAISLDAAVLVMDEPTAALSGVEVDRLLAVARQLRDEGRAILFISHRFEEVFELCDTVTVMRDGHTISTDAIGDVTVDELVRRMVGRDISNLYPKVPSTIGKVMLEVNGLSQPGVFHDISFEVHAGEIVGLAGLVGAGRSEVARAIFGIDPYRSGTVVFDGRPLPRNSVRAAIRAGIAMVPEDRRNQGLVMDGTVLENATSVIRRELARFGVMKVGAETQAAADWAGRLEVKAAALDTGVANLSGGNQQKVVLAKWLATTPRLLIIDEPTRGIDVGTKSEVHRRLSELASRGMAILMISSELPEVLGMADRVLVLSAGHLTANLQRAEATPERVMRAATNAIGQSASGTTGTEDK